MYAQVVVPSFKGPNENGFTYEIPNQLKVHPGQLVAVPFGKRQEIGVVISCHPERSEGSKTRFPIRSGMTNGILRSAQNDKTVVIKAINAVVFEKPFLLPYQLELLSWLAKYYLAGIGNCANAMLPTLPQKFTISNLQFTISNSNQTLVLVPTINNIPQTMALFPKAQRPLVFHSELKPQEKLEAWIKVMSRNCDYIFGTRQAIFLPFTKLRKIIMINEHDDSYKDQRSPYYDTLTVAEKVAALTGAKIEVIDPAPRITTFLRSDLDFAKQNLSNDKDLTLKIPSSERTVKNIIVSTAEERKVGNKTAISDELKYQMEENLKNGGNVLLYLNKKKESGTLYCNNCRYQEALAKKPEKCPNCGSEQIFFASLNINTLAKQVEKLFPKTKVNLISDNRQGLNPSITQGLTLSIDIATSSVFYRLLPKHYSLVAAISADSTLNVPEYTAPEKTYALITTLKRFTGKTLLLQTYNPENPSLIAGANSNYEEFYQEQIEQRKTLLYPPFSILIKLVIKGKNDEKTLTKAENLADRIRNQLPFTSNQQPIVLGPYESYFRKTSKTYNIVIKVPIKAYTLQNRETAVNSITSALENANAAKIANQVVIDPISLN